MKTSSPKQSTREIRVALGVMGIPKDVVVITPADYQQRKNLVGTVAYPAHREGRVLYERRR